MCDGPNETSSAGKAAVAMAGAAGCGVPPSGAFPEARSGVAELGGGGAETGPLDVIASGAAGSDAFPVGLGTEWLVQFFPSNQRMFPVTIGSGYHPAVGAPVIVSVMRATVPPGSASASARGRILPPA
ncbi:hypothetical protein [Cryobacterium sp. BB307]|uniref:hypothetical protein n=1 Tax=Cryobacterium sp. BB307 TaxID=2716317 RepID=UPI001FF093D6|nr:hypothetical protein [Cryobacterium sp. BB307]